MLRSGCGCTFTLQNDCSQVVPHAALVTSRCRLRCKLYYPFPAACSFTISLQAMEARRKERERPWLRLLAITTAASAVLLAAVLWRLEHMP